MDLTVKSFLKHLHIEFKPKPGRIFVIISGNESCDLDSIVSAIGYSYLKNHKDKDSRIYIPFCNVPRDDVDLRTEVLYWLKTVGLSKDDLITSSDINWLLKKDISKMIELILVDHLQVEQSNPFKDCPVKEIVDHRPLPDGYSKPKTCDYFNVNIVGSCSSLITELLFNELNPKDIPKDLCQLLYGAMLVDNDGFSPFALEIKKATKRDQDACSILLKHCGERLLNQGKTQKEVYEEIKRAKCDISGLSLQQLFRRDCKKVIIPDRPMIICSTITGVDCQKLPAMNGFFDEAASYCIQQNAHCLVCVTVGRIPNAGESCSNCCPKEALLDDGTRRGIVVTGPKQRLTFVNKLWQYLIANSGALSLVDIKAGRCCNAPIHQGIRIAVLTNPYATRKQLMPLLNLFLKTEFS